jgi:hypothetical protein
MGPKPSVYLEENSFETMKTSFNGFSIDLPLVKRWRIFNRDQKGDPGIRIFGRMF